MTAAHAHAAVRVTIGCSACIDEVRAAEETARWATAPRRRVTWLCSYVGVNDVRTLEFSMIVRVPTDADAAAVDAHYAGFTGEQFALALPDTVPVEFTDRACTTMEVALVTLGALIPDVMSVASTEPSLFEVASP